MSTELSTDAIEYCISNSWRTPRFLDGQDQFKALLDAFKKKDERIASMKATAKKRNTQIARLKAEQGDK